MSEKTYSSAKVAVWTAVITAIATVLTAFIAIVPQMRQGDKQQIDVLNSKLQKLATQIPASGYTVSGYVKTKKDSKPVTDAMLVAAPADDSVTLDDEGKFVLQNMANQHYCIVVQTQDGKMSRVLISPTDPETDTDDLAITYSFSKE
jgi:hypothetical protein